MDEENDMKAVPGPRDDAASLARVDEMKTFVTGSNGIGVGRLIYLKATQLIASVDTRAPAGLCDSRDCFYPIASPNPMNCVIIDFFLLFR